MLKRLRERMTPTDVVMWFIGAVILALVIWGSIATLSEGKYSSHHWFDFIVFGLAQEVSMPSSPWVTPWSMAFSE